MDGDLKAYLDTNFQAVNAKIDGLEKNMHERITPIKDDVVRLRTDVSDLYDKDRQQVTLCEQHRERTAEKIQSIQAWKTAVEAQNGNKRWRTEQVIVVIVGIIGLISGIVLAVMG